MCFPSRAVHPSIDTRFLPYRRDVLLSPSFIYDAYISFSLNLSQCISNQLSALRQTLSITSLVFCASVIGLYVIFPWDFVRGYRVTGVVALQGNDRPHMFSSGEVHN